MAREETGQCRSLQSVDRDRGMKRELRLSDKEMNPKNENSKRLPTPSWDQVLEAIGKGTPEVQELRKRPDSTVLRVQIEGTMSIIAKLWARPGWRGALRRLNGSGPMKNEWKILTRLKARGARVPDPLDWGYMRIPDQSYNQMILMEDLGKVQNGVEHVKALANGGFNLELEIFEEKLIEITRLMLDAGIIDTDHSLINTVALENGEPVRLDFEIARRRWFPRGHAKQIGQMLGRLVSSYIYSVQPDMKRAEAFALKASRSLSVGRISLNEAEKFIYRQLECQDKALSIQVDYKSPW